MPYSRLRASSLASLTVMMAALVASPLTTLPYEISPRKKVHETLTLMASDCLRKARQMATAPTCLPSPPVVRDDMDDKAFKDERPVYETNKLSAVSARELAEAVRWPDDPTDEVRGRLISRTIFKFIVKMKWQCKEQYSNGMKDGLLCSSHYGPLQFWHAMASSSKESTTQTRDKMLAWAKFLYDVVAGDILGEDYCRYWKEQRDKGNGELANILAPEKEFPCAGVEEPWKISTLFSMSCEGPFSSKTCTEWLDPRLARVTALGALLHMVQDSYAQGHASRGMAELIPGTKRVKSKFECLPINQFYTYGEQDDKKHRQADFYPQPGLSCTGTSTGVVDPVQASATVLWYVQQEKGATALAEYLDKYVFLLAEEPEPQAGAGGPCFLKKTPKDDPCPQSK